jgi:CubicO group peptidase (beta-lactamase class C family)
MHMLRAVERVHLQRRSGASVVLVTTARRPLDPTRRLLVAAACLLLAAACSSGDSGGGSGGGGGDGAADGSGGAAGGEAATADDVTFPGAEWERGDAAELGFDPAVLDALAAEAEQAGSNCLLVVRDGRVAAEWYWNGTDATSSQEVFSVTKSHTSTLVGIARADGDLALDDPASDYIDAWVGTESEDVTIENLLSNDSGREWSLAIDYQQLPTQPDHDEFATGLGQDHAPGESWAYNNSAIQTLDVVLREATGQDVHAYAAERLYEPLGMDHTEMTTDAAGNTRTFMGVQSTCEDLARFGYLFLRGGDWDGTQVVPGEWVDAAVGRPSQELSDAYGYLWWLNRSGTVLSPTQATSPGAPAAEGQDTQMVPGAPEDMFFALGLGNQVVAVDPGSETVVVRLGGAGPPDGAEPFDVTRAATVVTEALVDAG